MVNSTNSYVYEYICEIERIFIKSTSYSKAVLQNDNIQQAQNIQEKDYDRRHVHSKVIILFF